MLRFQYVSCQFDALRGLPNRPSIRKALTDLPVGLDATYNRILQAIKPEYRKQVSNILKWLAFSRKPLSTEELAEIFILDHDRNPPFNKGHRLLKIVLEYLPSLVQSDNRFLRKTFRLAHFSIQEYLVSDRIARGPAMYFSTKEIEAHLHISNACLAYHLHLSAIILVTEEQCNHFALWKYAAINWAHHLEHVPPAAWTPSTIKMASQALTPRSQNLLNMSRIRNPDDDDHDWTMDFSDLALPLYYLAALGTTQLITFLLDRQCNVGHYINELSPIGSKFGFALAAATRRRKTNIVTLLLNRGADINLQGGDFQSALQAAAYYGNDGTLQLLIKEGANINANEGSMGSALQSASFEANERTMQLLLDKGAEINATGGSHGSVLQAAAQARHSRRSIVKFLIGKGADANVSGGKFGSALAAAAFFGYNDIIQLLLDERADINLKTRLSYGNALYAAIAGDKTECAEFLIKRGAKVWPPWPRVVGGT